MSLLHSVTVGVVGLAVLFTVVLLVTRGDVDRFMDSDFLDPNGRMAAEEREAHQRRARRLQWLFICLVVTAVTIAYAAGVER